MGCVRRGPPRLARQRQQCPATAPRITFSEECSCRCTRLQHADHSLHRGGGIGGGREGDELQLLVAPVAGGLGNRLVRRPIEATPISIVAQICAFGDRRALTTCAALLRWPREQLTKGVASPRRPGACGADNVVVGSFALQASTLGFANLLCSGATGCTKDGEVRLGAVTSGGSWRSRG